jgi:hypothetical protein
MSEKHIVVGSIVAQRNNQPYVRIHINGDLVAQLTLGQARTIAQDLIDAAARGEADAMIWKFFSKQQFPQGAGEALMMEFREFRQRLDEESVERSYSDPENLDITFPRE